MNYPLTGRENSRERKSNDKIIDVVLGELSNCTGLDYSPFDSQAFHITYKRVSETFVVRKSSITTRMARLLYGISAMTKPKNVLVIGSALSNALIWLAIPVLDTADKIVGVDLNQEDNEESLANLKRYGANNVQILTMNGLDANCIFSTIDLLFIDIYSDTHGKLEYVDIVEKLYSLLEKGALVLAHDICHPKFMIDLALYLAIVRDKNNFQCTCSIGIDRYGLEVSMR